MVLTLRSSLQAAARFAGSLSEAEKLDQSLRETLATHKQSVAECRSRQSVGLVRQLPSNWWWRSDSPG